MIKIRKDNRVLTVTPGAYQNFYKHLGYEPVGVARNAENSGEGSTHPDEGSHHLEDSTQPENGELDPDDEEELTDDEDEADEEPELSEIPLSEMGFDQLCQYADELGLDHDGIRSKKEMRALIRDHLN